MSLLGLNICVAQGTSLLLYLGYFQVFLSFIEKLKMGGVGKNGSTVAVRKRDVEVDCTNKWHNAFYFAIIF